MKQLNIGADSYKNSRYQAAFDVLEPLLLGEKASFHILDSLSAKQITQYINSFRNSCMHLNKHASRTEVAILKAELIFKNFRKNQMKPEELVTGLTDLMKKIKNRVSQHEKVIVSTFNFQKALFPMMF